MPAEPRLIWGGILVPAPLHRAVGSAVGPRGLNRAAETGISRLLSGECVCSGPRPPRDGGSVTVTVRVPVQLGEAADRWRAERGMSRQALVEYALMVAFSPSQAPGQCETAEAIGTADPELRQ